MMNAPLTPATLFAIAVVLPIAAATLGHSVPSSANYIGHDETGPAKPNGDRIVAPSGLIDVGALNNVFLVGHLLLLSARKSAFAQGTKRAESVSFNGIFLAREFATLPLKKLVEGGTLGV